MTWIWRLDNYNITTNAPIAWQKIEIFSDAGSATSPSK